MQRQLAIQRLQEQEKERQMRLEQQKHTIQMRAQMPAFSLPYTQVRTATSTLLTQSVCHSVQKIQSVMINYIITLLTNKFCIICIRGGRLYMIYR